MTHNIICKFMNGDNLGLGVSKKKKNVALAPISGLNGNYLLADYDRSVAVARIA